ncbi:MAG: hypothetical protein Q7S65_01405 [Nanoarchaeota archaeon]|nr:hypothetical protein [Nanoarchaeota archaeon]
MSQIEQMFRQLLAKKPEIEKCYASGLVNRRALARYLVKEGVAKANQMEAVVAMLRRYGFSKEGKETRSVFHGVRMHVKDNILILDFEKSRELLKELQKLIAQIDYDKGDTLKIVVGSAHITVYVDADKEKAVKELFSRFQYTNRHRNISEISLLFPPTAIDAKGVFSTITRELALHGITITELLTSSSELLLYLKDEYVLKALEVLKGLQKV